MNASTSIVFCGFWGWTTFGTWAGKSVYTVFNCKIRRDFDMSCDILCKYVENKG